MDFDGCNQQIGVTGSLIIDFVVDNNLVLCLLKQLH
jgi:hypothetical protein